MEPQNFFDSDLLQKLLSEKRAAREYQERKHENWNDTYTLSRNKVRTNRLTQRQSVNIPLMKETEKTLLSKIDDAPVVDWQELAGEKEKEIIMQENWNRDMQRLNMEGMDVLDKKNVIRYGRSFRKLNWTESGIDINVMDIFDIVIDPFVDPLNIETARFLIHQNIFRSLREILANDRYNDDAKDALKKYLSTKEGIIQTGKNKEENDKKNERLKAMGVRSDEFALFAGGDVVLNLTEHYTLLWNKDKKRFDKCVIVYADDTVQLMNEKLEELIGVDFWPFVTWSEDVETDDFWNDGPLDLVRVPNKVLNIWFSQLVENRTLRNFQMHWYDATVQGYNPQTYEPGPGKMLPAPGDPNKTIMPVNIQGLDETLTAIDFLIRVVERGTGATAIEKGVGEKKQITLGEVNVLVGKAMERAVNVSKAYKRAQEELAIKWYKMMDANATKKVTLYRTGRDGRVWPKTVYASDWRSEAGYRPIVRSSSEQEEEAAKGVQKLFLIKQQFPNNPVLNRIIQKRVLELVDLTPEEIREVEQAEENIQKQNEQRASADLQATLARSAPPTESPQEPEMLKGLEEKIGSIM